MSIKVRYFASLKDNIGCSEDELNAAENLTVLMVWQSLNHDQPLPSNTLVAVNMEYAGLDFIVQDGDEVAFFPPVTGGCK